MAQEIGGTSPGGRAAELEQQLHQRLVEEVLWAFTADTNIPWRYTEAFTEYGREGQVLQRATDGINIRRVAQPEGGYRVEVLIHSSLRNNPQRLFIELRHDLNSYYARRATDVPRGMPLLEDLPGDDVRLQLGQRTAAEYWHAGRILDFAAEHDIPVADAIRRIRTDPLRP